MQVLYFFYPNMPFHRKLLFILSQMAAQYSYIYSAIDVEYFPTQNIRFSISSVPSILFMKCGAEIKRLVATVKKQDINNAFADILHSNGD